MDGAQTLHQQLSLWINPECGSPDIGATADDIILGDISAAEQRLANFAPLLARRFPELVQSGGLVESPLLPLPAEVVGECASNAGRFWVKADHQLAVAGSVKARGGFHEVLEFAEKVAIEHGLIAGGVGHHRLDSPDAREVFSRYEVAVSSTGNLGMSIGIMSAALGFRATVHMSAEAKAWKKKKLRSHGVTVLEHKGDYGQAVAQGRAQASSNPSCHFVDDEHSSSLFSGYAVAARRLRDQFAQQRVSVDAAHPLFVYIPCGVGGAPGGVCYGLKHLFGASVHCFFVEPVDSTCFLVRMQHQGHPGISIYDVGQGNRTIADGLAVPCASEFVYPLMRTRLAGVAVATDDMMRADLWRLHAIAGLKVEPSAAASVVGPRALLSTPQGQQYLEQRGLTALLPDAHHIAWTTGGALMPAEEHNLLLAEGRAVAQAATPAPRAMR